jgi:hypothetical protein
VETLYQNPVLVVIALVVGGVVGVMVGYNAISLKIRREKEELVRHQQHEKEDHERELGKIKFELSMDIKREKMQAEEISLKERRDWDEKFRIERDSLEKMRASLQESIASTKNNLTDEALSTKKKAFDDALEMKRSVIERLNEGGMQTIKDQREHDIKVADRQDRVAEKVLDFAQKIGEMRVQVGDITLPETEIRRITSPSFPGVKVVEGK